MRSYELMFIFDPDVDPTDSKKLDSYISKFLGKSSEYIKSTDVIGKKKLKYSINKKSEGVYALVKLEAPRIDSEHLVKQAKLMPEIIRFLFTVKKK